MTDDGVELIDRVQAAVLAVPGVADLHGGVFGEAGTYLPGRKVAGVRLREDVAEVHVTLEHGPSVPETADRIRAAVSALVDTPVHVMVEDVVTAAVSTNHDPEPEPASRPQPDFPGSPQDDPHPEPHTTTSTDPDGEHS